MVQKKTILRPPDWAAPDLPFWQEALFGIEILLLHASPVFYGWGVPRGDGSAVVLIPGFLGTDIYLVEMYAWLRRIGYEPYYSGIGLNAECPNLLIRSRLTQTIERAVKDTGRKIHLLGHSLGGLLARSVAAERPDQVESVITLGAPFRGTVLHPSVKNAVEQVRKHILQSNGNSVLPDCYTGQCTCSFLNSLMRNLPSSVAETCVYTLNDGIVDWRYCITADDANNFAVSGTHIGLVFNPTVYDVIANRLAAPRTRRS